MKRITIFVLIFICIIYSTGCSAQDIMWEKSIGGKHADFLFDAIPTADYGFILAGSSLSDKSGKKKQGNNGNLDYFIWKMNEHGEEEWQKSFGGSGIDLLKSVRITTDGGFILAGTSNSPKDGDKSSDCKGGTDFWIIKLDASGGEQWQKTVGGTGMDEVANIVIAKDGGYLIAGSSDSEISGDKIDPCEGNLDYFIIKLNRIGDIEWQKTFGGDSVDILRAAESTADGGFILGGYSNSSYSGTKISESYGGGDYWVLKLDATGNVEWQNQYGGSKDDQLYSVKQTRDGGYIIGGNSNSVASGNMRGGSKQGSDIWVLKTNDEGQILWQESYNYGEQDILSSIIVNKDGSFLISGYSQKEEVSPASVNVKKLKSKSGADDFLLLKIDYRGQEIWTKTIGSDGTDILLKGIETRDGGYLLSGTSNGSASGDKKSSIGSNDFWTVKIKDRDKSQPFKQNIEAIPNPAKNFTNIIVGYNFSKGSASLFDIGGRMLQKFTINSRTIPINLEGYPDGVYIVQIKTEISVDSVKVIKGSTNN